MFASLFQGILIRLAAGFSPGPLLVLFAGLYLLFLARAILRHPALPESAAETPNTNLRDAVLINLLNPYPYIFWGIVLGPTITALWRDSPAAGIACAGGFYLALIPSFITWIAVFSRAGRAGPQVQRMLGLLSGAGMAGLGLGQLASGAKMLLRL